MHDLTNNTDPAWKVGWVMIAAWAAFWGVGYLSGIAFLALP